MTSDPAELTATVLVPTTGDRGPLLAHSVGSVLAQTVTDLEVFLVGDGITDDTRVAATALVARDPRVHLFEFPKHERRGEPHRHALLHDRARGRIVAYLCDRDLWLPDHLSELDRLLADADFAHTLRFRIDQNGRTDLYHTHDLRVAADRAVTRPGRGFVPLSFAGHTADAYRRLPFGWRTTPVGVTTDRYMWEQFLDQPWVRVATSARPTVLSFVRGAHPGWPTARRLAELERWSARLADRSGVDEIRGRVLDDLWAEWARLAAADRSRRDRGLDQRVARARRRAGELVRWLARLGTDRDPRP